MLSKTIQDTCTSNNHYRWNNFRARKLYKYCKICLDFELYFKNKVSITDKAIECLKDLNAALIKNKNKTNDSIEIVSADVNLFHLCDHFNQLQEINNLFLDYLRVKANKPPKRTIDKNIYIYPELFFSVKELENFEIIKHLDKGDFSNVSL